MKNLDRYKEFLIYKDQDTFMFEKESSDININIIMNDYDIFIQINNVKIEMKNEYLNREFIFKNLVFGCYSIKKYYDNDILLYSKIIWREKQMQKYNQKTKYGIHFCRKINRIEVVQGVKW